MPVIPRPPGEATTLRELFERAITSFPDRVAFRRKNPDGYGLWTYKDVHEYVLRFSGALLELGVKKGDRIVILADNRPEWGVAYFSITAIGAVAVPLDRMLGKTELAELLARSGARFAVAPEAFTPPLLEALAKTPTIEKILSMEQPKGGGVVVGYEELLARGERSGRNYHEVEVNANDLLSIFYTPGTTGDPKGVMITHGNVAFEAGALSQVSPYLADDCQLSLLPMNHLQEFMAGFIVPFVCGSQVAYINSLLPSRIFEALSECRVTRIVGVPLLFTLFHREVAERVEKLSGLQKFLFFRSMDVARSVRFVTGNSPGKLLFKRIHEAFGGHLRQFVVGGAQLDPDLVNRILDAGFPLHVGYGMTETASVSAFGSAGVMPRGAVGKAIPGVKISIYDPSPGGIGEIVISGPNVMHGYFQDPARTREALVDGVLHTGDLGHMDSDGHVFLTGRIKEMIRTGGPMLFPDDLERSYGGLKLVRELSVVGVPTSDGGREEPVAVVVVDPNDADAPKDRAGLENAIKAEFVARSSEVPPEQVVKKLVFRETPLPKTSTMKVKRLELVKTVAGEGSPAVGLDELIPAKRPAHPAKSLPRFTQQPKNFHEFLELCAKSYGDHTALSMWRDNRWITLSYKDVLDKARSVARQLRTAGMQFGDHACLLGESSPEWVIHFYGALIAGGVVIPLDPKLTPSELGNIVAHCEPRFFIAAPSHRETARKLKGVPAKPYKIWSLDEVGYDSLLDPEALPEDPRTSDQTILISYTSGTSGAPKGVMLSARSLLFEAIALRVMDPEGEKSVTLTILPLNHLYGLSAGLIFAMSCGTEFCMAHDLQPQAIVHCLKSRHVTRLFAVPLFAKMLLRGIKRKVEENSGVAKRGIFWAAVKSMARSPIRPLQNLFFREIHENFGSSLKQMVCGGAELDPEAANFFRAINIPVFIGYGLTETGPVVSANTVADNRARSVGKVIPGVEVKIVKKNPEDFGGEIWIRGPNVMNGYFKNPELTAQSITPDGWFLSGDVGWVDSAGFLYVLGKQKALIVLSSGKKVHPEEVESVLSRSPLIKEVCVIGLASRNEGGEVPTAVVFPAEDLLKKYPESKDLKPLIRKEVDELSQELAPYKRAIRLVIRRTPFVLTTSMKIKRDVLRAEMEQKTPRPKQDRRRRSQ
jgi:long-subunit acyl-CoA synthetase (AMP-forming)